MTFQKEEECGTIEEVEIVSRDVEGVSQDQVRRNWAVDGNGKPLRETDLGSSMICFVFQKITSDNAKNGLEWLIRLEAG